MNKIKLIILPILLTLCLLIPLVNCSTTYFSSNFNNIILPEWEYKNSYVLNSTIKFEGAYSVSAGSDSFSLQANFTEHKLCYVIFVIKFENLEIPASPSRNILLIYGDTGDTIGIDLYKVGTQSRFCFYSTDLGGYKYGVTNLASNVWYGLQLRAEISTTTNISLWCGIAGYSMTWTLENSQVGNNDGVDGFNTVELMASGKGTEYSQQFIDFLTIKNTFTNWIIQTDYSGFYFKIGLGIVSIIAVIIAPILSDKVAETKFGKIFLCLCIWLFFGFLFYQWIYMW